MDPKYAEWISDWLSKNNPYGKCEEAATAMAEIFENLTIVKGHVYCDWGKRSHWWCVDTQGTIVDPTKSQFGSITEYDPWEPGNEVCAGKCMNCGEEIWVTIQSLDNSVHESICSKKCEAEFEEYLKEEMEKP